MELMMLLGFLFVVVSTLVAMSKGAAADTAQEAGIGKGVTIAFAAVMVFIAGEWLAHSVPAAVLEGGFTARGNWFFAIPVLLLFGFGKRRRT